MTLMILKAIRFARFMDEAFREARAMQRAARRRYPSLVE